MYYYIITFWFVNMFKHYVEAYSFRHRPIKSWIRIVSHCSVIYFVGFILKPCTEKRSAASFGLTDVPDILKIELENM